MDPEVYYEMTEHQQDIADYQDQVEEERVMRKQHLIDWAYTDQRQMYLWEIEAEQD